MNLAVMLTAKLRPYYLEATLESWSRARTIEACPVTIALGDSPREPQMLDVIGRTLPSVHVGVLHDRVPGGGMHRAIWDAMEMLFTDREAEFVVAGEEDEIVSDDVLEYFRWAAEEFRYDDRVLAVCAHSRGGQGWDEHVPADDADADQETVRLLPYFNAWVWGTWNDRWAGVLAPNWDHDCTSGGPNDSGWDWNIATRILPMSGMLCVVPDASRSQNIGYAEGWATTPQSFSFSQAQSFREHREVTPYRIVV